jgi:hypothetical protein
MEKTKFNPKDHLLELMHNQKQPDGSYKKIKTEYLPVAWRIVWMRTEKPEWQITTDIVTNTDMYAVVKASIFADGYTRPFATAHKREDKAGWGDYMEKAETGAIGRALALCGFGTQFSPEIEEGVERIVDSPVEVKKSTKVVQETAEVVQEVPVKVGKPASDTIRKMYFAVAKTAGYDSENAKKIAKDIFKVESFNDIGHTNLQNLITKLAVRAKAKMKEQDDQVLKDVTSGDLDDQKDN